MSTIGGFYVNRHLSQYDAGSQPITRTSGCTWTTGANGANASSGGHVALTPDQVHDLVKRSEETSPNTPGWSLPDLALAMSRAHVPFQDRSGKGWDALVTAHRAGLYIACQGDSDQFDGQTCSGKFDGDHCIGIHPAEQTVNGILYWWIADPICPMGRWEKASVVRLYAQKLSSTIRFGVFLNPVPKAVPAKYRVQISGRVPVYDKPYGKVVGHVVRADYTCTRTRTSARWWYRVVTRSDGTPSTFRGRYIPQEKDPPMHVTRLP